MCLTAVKLLSVSVQAPIHRLNSTEEASTEIERREGSLPIGIFHIHVNTHSQDSASNSNLGDSYLPPFRRQPSRCYCGRRSCVSGNAPSTLWKGASRFIWLSGWVLLAAFVLY